MKTFMIIVVLNTFFGFYKDFLRSIAIVKLFAIFIAFYCAILMSTQHVQKYVPGKFSTKFSLVENFPGTFLYMLCQH